jgi:hypothetical protein
VRTTPCSKDRPVCAPPAEPVSQLTARFSHSGSCRRKVTRALSCPMVPMKERPVSECSEAALTGRLWVLAAAATF